MKKVALSIILCFVAAVLSYFWIDRAIAWFVYDNDISVQLSQFSDVSLAKPAAQWFAFFGFAYFLTVYLLSTPKKGDIAILLASISVAITSLLIDDCIKCVIHRYWPLTWNDNNPSLISNNAYGFYVKYHCHSKNGAFPSGHTGISFAFLSVFWLLYRKFMALYIACAIVVVAGLLIMNYHFLSDIIVGGFIGSFVGFWAVEISGTKQFKEPFNPRFKR